MAQCLPIISYLVLDFFIVSNGVKQDGIFSPHLFYVSMGDLSVNFNKLQIGCICADMVMNHMMYADDFCNFLPSISGFMKLTDCSACMVIYLI